VGDSGEELEVGAEGGDAEGKSSVVDVDVDVEYNTVTLFGVGDDIFFLLYFMYICAHLILLLL
jgi:hypothetical protein